MQTSQATKPIPPRYYHALFFVIGPRQEFLEPLQSSGRRSLPSDACRAIQKNRPSLPASTPRTALYLQIDANFPFVNKHKSAGDSSISSPRRPALTNIVSNPVDESSMSVTNGFFCPSGLIPPSTYPVVFSAALACAIAAFFAPSALAKRLRSN